MINGIQMLLRNVLRSEQKPDALIGFPRQNELGGQKLLVGDWEKLLEFGGGNVDVFPGGGNVEVSPA